MTERPLRPIKKNPSRPAPQPIEDADLQAPFVRQIPEAHPLAAFLVEKSQAVIDARKKHADLLARYRATRDEHLAAAKSLGLDPDYTLADVDEATGNLLVNGGDHSAIEKLDQLSKRQRALYAATKAALPDIDDALKAATLDANHRLESELLAPIAHAVAEAYLQFVRHLREQKELVSSLRGLGLSYGRSGPQFSDKVFLDPSNVGDKVRELVASGAVDSAEVTDLIR